MCLQTRQTIQTRRALENVSRTHVERVGECAAAGMGVVRTLAGWPVRDVGPQGLEFEHQVLAWATLQSLLGPAAVPLDLGTLARYLHGHMASTCACFAAVVCASSVTSLAHALGSTSSPLRLAVVLEDRRLDDLGYAAVVATCTGDLLLAVRLQSASRVSDLSSLPRRAENGAGP